MNEFARAAALAAGLLLMSDANAQFNGKPPEDAGGQLLSESHKYGRDHPDYRQNMLHFIRAMPKAELHVHFEGTLTPPKILELAARNNIEGLPQDIPGIHRMLASSVLTQFLEGLAKSRSVMVTQQDFYEVAYDFALRQLENNVVYTELMFDPQGHTSRGVAFDTMMSGLVQAKQEAAEKLGIRIELLMQLHRDRSRESALQALEDAQRWKAHIVGVGMDNGPQEGYAEKLEPVMLRARELGFHISGHIDRYELDYEKNLAWLLQTLKVGRVDHGINIMDTPQLIPTAREREVTFTVCGATTYSDNPALYEDSGFKLYTRRIDEMTEAGLKTTINTDDPGYFAGIYLSEMIQAFYEENGYTREQLLDFQRRAFGGAWLSEADKRAYLAALDAYAAAGER
ncbi:adenosine deaminase [Mangrovimicrobium sediminis]|uniref:Adenosine deaminase n=1 Tax=Mangrovimicrobium sediminis TaxID=2562682 RepID=A0A4Z0M580_9GAMM|nr:adenosine deaminase [Haliea sp. SAOS-164]TGD74634.1 adenosine deaminase [Haliea sp. SAOS-164]